MIDNKKAIILVLLYLSAAFDTVDHNLLLSGMMTRISIGGTVLTWMKSYISFMIQRVSIGDVFSFVATIRFGVVWLIYFTIYTLPIGHIAQTHGLNVHFYADDVQLYMAFDSRNHEDTTAILTKVENCMSD